MEITPESSSSSSRYYGRRKGRPLHKRKAELMRELLPRLAINLPETVGAFAPSSLFAPEPKAVWLEIGFGGGEHLAAQAAVHGDVGFIGCEPFENGVASLLDHIDRQNIANIRIFPDDARLLLDAMPDGCCERCFVLFADPWPKKRHEDRRFIGAENLPRLARILRSGGELLLATDVAQLAGWMRKHVAADPSFTCVYDGGTPPDGWIATRYEQKGVEAGRAPIYLRYRRNDRHIKDY